MVFVTVDIPVRVLSNKDAEPTEVFFFELNLHKKKWLVSCSYNPHRNNLARHLEISKRRLDL